MNVKWIGKGLNESLLISKKKLSSKLIQIFRPSEVNFLVGNFSKAKRIR